MSVLVQVSICIEANQCQYQNSSASVPCQYQNSSASVPCQYQKSSMSVPCHYQYSSVSVPCQYQYSSVSVPCQYQNSWVSVPCRYQNSSVSVPCRYQNSSVSVPCQYQNSPVSGCVSIKTLCRLSQYQNSSLSVPFQYQNSSASVPYQNSSVSVPCQYQNSPVFNWLLNQVVTYYRYNIVVKLIVKSGGNLLSLQHCSNHFVDWLTDWLIQSLRRSSRNRVTYLSFRLFVFNPSPTHFFTGVFASFLLVLWSWYFELYFNTMSTLGGVRLFLVSRLSSQTHCDRQGLVTAPLISQSDQPCAVITWTSASLTTWRP